MSSRAPPLTLRDFIVTRRVSHDVFGWFMRPIRAAGIAAAKELVFAAKRISAARAHELGIVGNVVETGQAEKEAMSLARDIAAGGPLAVRLAKRAMDTGMQVCFGLERLSWEAGG